MAAGDVTLWKAPISGFNILATDLGAAGWTQMTGTDDLGQSATHVIVLQNGAARWVLDKTTGTSTRNLRGAFMVNGAWIEALRNQGGGSHDWQDLTAIQIERNDRRRVSILCTALNRNSSQKTVRLAMIRVVPFLNITTTVVPGSPSTWGSLETVPVTNIEGTVLLDLPAATPLLRDIYGVVGSSSATGAQTIGVPCPVQGYDILLSRSSDVSNELFISATEGFVIAVNPDGALATHVVGFLPRTYTSLVTTSMGPGNGQLLNFSDYRAWEGETPLVGTELLTNGGFETDLTGWTQTAGSWSRVTTQKKFGTASVQVTADGTAKKLSQVISGLTVGEVVAFHGWARISGGAGSGKVKLTMDDVAATSHVTLTGSDNPEWSFLVVTFTATATSHTAYCQVESGVTAGTVQFDGLSFVKVKNADGTSALAFDTRSTTGWAQTGGTGAPSVVDAPRGKALQAVDGATGGSIQFAMSPQDWSRYQTLVFWSKQTTSSQPTLSIVDAVGGSQQIIAVEAPAANVWGLVRFNIDAAVRTEVTAFNLNYGTSGLTRVRGSIRLSEHNVAIGQKHSVWHDMEETSLAMWLKLDETTGTDGSNLVANPGFETYPTSPGVPDSWSDNSGGLSTFTKETTIIDAGANAVRITLNSGSPGGLLQAISPTGGITYLIRCRTRTGGQATARPRLAIINLTDDNSVAADIAGTAAGIVYETLAVTFEAIAGKSYRLVLNNNSTPTTGDQLYFDEVSLQEIQAKDASGNGNHGKPKASSDLTNKVTNGGFETYTTTPGVPDSYTDISGGSATFAKETTIKRTGANAVKITAGATPSTTEGLEQALSGLTVGRLYIAEAYARTSGVAGEQARFIVRNTTDSIDTDTATGVDATTTYTRLVTSFTPAAGKSYSVRMMHAGTPAAGDIVYFDDINVYQDGTAGPTIAAATVRSGLGTCFSFDGSNDFVEVPDANGLDISSAITLEAWVNADQFAHTGGPPRFISKGGAYQFLTDTAGKPQVILNIGGDTSYVATNAISALAWHHLVATYDGVNVKIYVDGALADTFAQTGAITTSGSPLIIGNLDAGITARYWDGKIDEVRVYSRALGADEVAMRFNAVVHQIRGWKPTASTRTLSQTTDKKEGTYAIRLGAFSGSLAASIDFMAPQDWSIFTYLALWHKRDSGTALTLKVTDAAGAVSAGVLLTGAAGSYVYERIDLSAFTGVDLTRLTKLEMTSPTGDSSNTLVDAIRLFNHATDGTIGDWRYVVATGTSGPYAVTVGNDGGSTSTLAAGHGQKMSIDVPAIGKYYIGVMASVDAGTPTLELYVDGVASGTPMTILTTGFDVQVEQLVFGPFTFASAGTHTIEARLATLSTATRLRLDFAALYPYERTASTPATFITPKDMAHSLITAYTPSV